LLSVVGGFVYTPAGLGNIHAFADFLKSALPNLLERPAGAITEMGSEALVTLAFLTGLGIAYLIYFLKPGYARALTGFSLGKTLHQFWFADWGMDWLYDRALVRPVAWFAHFDRADFIDSIYAGMARLGELAYIALRSTENGRVRWYAAGIAVGAVTLVSMVLFL
jgi:NADH-quinone oxidoreductase subunit L